jgi:hypothetical protein
MVFVLGYLSEGVLFGLRCGNPRGAHAGISLLAKYLVMLRRIEHVPNFTCEANRFLILVVTISFVLILA